MSEETQNTKAILRSAFLQGAGWALKNQGRIKDADVAVKAAEAFAEEFVSQLPEQDDEA